MGYGWCGPKIQNSAKSIDGGQRSVAGAVGRCVLYTCMVWTMSAGRRHTKMQLSPDTEMRWRQSLLNPRPVTSSLWPGEKNIKRNGALYLQQKLGILAYRQIIKDFWNWWNLKKRFLYYIYTVVTCLCSGLWRIDPPLTKSGNLTVFDNKASQFLLRNASQYCGLKKRIWETAVAGLWNWTFEIPQLFFYHFLNIFLIKGKI